MEKRVTKNDDGTITVSLMKKITLADKEITQVTMRGEATVADLEAMDGGKGEVGKSIRLVSELSGLSLAAIRKIDSADFAAIGTVLSGILGNESPGTGETS